MTAIDTSRGHEIDLLEQIAQGGGGTAGGAAPTTAAVVGGVYNTSPPTLDNGDLGQAQMDVNGNLKTVEQNVPVYEDNVNGKAVVEQRNTPFAISTATTTLVKSGAGYVDEIIVVGGTLGAVTIYDSLTATGTVLLPTATPVQNGILLRHIVFGTGLCIVTASATVIVGGYR